MKAGRIDRPLAATTARTSSLDTHISFIRHLQRKFGERVVIREQGQTNKRLQPGTPYTLITFDGHIDGSDGVYSDSFDKLRFTSRFNYQYTISHKYNGRHYIVKVNRPENPMFIDSYAPEVVFRASSNDHATKASLELNLGKTYLFVQGKNVGVGKLDCIYQPTNSGGAVVLFTEEGVAFETKILNKDLAVIPVTIVDTKGSNYENTIRGITEMLNHSGIRVQCDDIKTGIN